MRFLTVLLLSTVLLAGCATTVTDLSAGQTGWVSYPSSEASVRLRGQLLLPSVGAAPYPAMIVAHGSGGLDARSTQWADYLRKLGIATLVIDYFGPRGVVWSSPVQPTPVTDIHDALRLLASHPAIDRSRIGVMGFSRGGVLAMEAANADTQDIGGLSYAAHVALYPPCIASSIRRRGPGAPILVLIGSNDDVAAEPQCEYLVSSARDAGRDAKLIVYQGGYHGFDGPHGGFVTHRASGRSYRMHPDAAITRHAHEDVRVFLGRALNLNH
jgi:dienelactone hydrolase